MKNLRLTVKKCALGYIANTRQSCNSNIGLSASRTHFLNPTKVVTLMGHPSGGTQQVDGNTICETERELRTRSINLGTMGIKLMLEGMAVKRQSTILSDLRTETWACAIHLLKGEQNIRDDFKTLPVQSQCSFYAGLEFLFWFLEEGQSCWQPTECLFGISGIGISQRRHRYFASSSL